MEYRTEVVYNLEMEMCGDQVHILLCLLLIKGFVDIHCYGIAILSNNWHWYDKIYNCRVMQKIGL